MSSPLFNDGRELRSEGRAFIAEPSYTLKEVKNDMTPAKPKYFSPPRKVEQKPFQPFLEHA